MDHYEIREATTADLLEMLDHERESPLVPLTEDEMREHIEDKRHTCYVAAQDHIVMGHAIFTKLGSTILVVERLVVGPDWQRNGVATSLMAAIRNDFDVKVMTATTADCNAQLPAQKFLKKEGFRGRLIPEEGVIHFTCDRRPDRPAFVNRLSSIMG